MVDGATLSTSHVIRIFNNVQEDNMQSEDDLDDILMDFNEFCEALCAVACFKYADPYVALEQRIEVFFLQHMIKGFSEQEVKKFLAMQRQKKAKAMAKSASKRQSHAQNPVAR